MIDATVVGSGPNGLAAAVTLARAGLTVELLERDTNVGGGLRTGELTLPGYRHDICSAIHPAALASPFFQEFRLTDRVPFVIPEISYAHPLVGGRAGIAYRDLQRTADHLGSDGPRWRRLLEPLVRRLEGVVDFTGSQLLRWPEHPLAALSYGLRSIEQGSPLWNLRFSGITARAMLTGVAAHAGGPLPSLATAGAGLLLAAHAHAGGWGFPVGGSQAIADALADDFRAHGGTVHLGHNVKSPADLTPSRVTILDTGPRFARDFVEFPPAYARALGKYRYGSGVAKVDFALAGSVPWINHAVGSSPTVHLGGSRRHIALAEREVSQGRMPRQPYVLVVQPSILDDSRAPVDHQVLWAYTHVPSGSSLDGAEIITREIEAFAPGFRDLILARSSLSAVELERHNPNYVGGDILGGRLSLRQLVWRPAASATPWKTPVDGLYLCSAATPPGPAVHGMNGWYAATLALREKFDIHSPPHLG